MNEMIIGCIMRRVDGESLLSRLVLEVDDGQQSRIHFKYMTSTDTGISFLNMQQMWDHIAILNRYDNEYTFVPSTAYQYCSKRELV